jgi:DNA-directed RNA polymerase specialized sigma24 family protein
MSIALARATARNLKGRWHFDGSVPDIMRKLSEMTDLQRIVVGLRYYDELDSRRIAEVLDIPEDRVVRIFVEALEPLLVSTIPDPGR